MGISFTPDQQKVIELHERNILVSAAAGSGKTAVLVERIIRMVCDEAHPVDIDRLLIVTFTGAAAAEMRERISQGIARQQKLHPQSEHIEKQATLLHNALITTIDSFCLYLIKNHFHEIGLDPAFRVADEGEIVNVAIDPKCRQKGYGARLVRDLLLLGQELGAERFFLEVRKGNVAGRALYTSLGFVECGIRKGFYENPKEDAVLMMWEKVSQ